MATTNITSSITGGTNTIRSANSTSWATVRGASTGTVGGTESDQRVSSDFQSPNYWIDRFFLWFDTSSIPANATVNSAIVKLYFYSTAASNINTITFHLVPATMASNTLVSGDFNNLTFSSKGSIAYTSISDAAYNNITLDTAAVTLGSQTKLAVITSRDLNNSAPTGRNERSIQEDTEANPPILTLDYTVPSAGMFFAM